VSTMLTLRKSVVEGTEGVSVTLVVRPCSGDVTIGGAALVESARNLASKSARLRQCWLGNVRRFGCPSNGVRAMLTASHVRGEVKGRKVARG